MTDKELLLKDLCARLPYGVKAMEHEDEPPFTIDSYDKADFIDGDNWIDSDGWNHNITKTKPYLFPLSSMTESQNDSWRDAFLNDLAMSATINYPESEKYLALSHFKSMEWLYKHHFDVNGLIEKGLALDATGLGIY